jgi:hypothetical protein
METVLWTLSLRRLAPRVAFLQVIGFAKMFNVYKDHMIIMIKKNENLTGSFANLTDFTWDNFVKISPSHKASTKSNG